MYSPYLNTLKNITVENNPENKKRFWGFWKPKEPEVRPLVIPGAVIIKDSKFNETYAWEEF